MSNRPAVSAGLGAPDREDEVRDAPGHAASGSADGWIHLAENHTYGTLVLEDKKGRVKEQFPMERSVISIGRAMENDVRFLKTEISRVHCRIIFSEETGEASLEVLGASGVILNGIAEKPAFDERGEPTRVPLCEGDLLEIAKRGFRMRFPGGVFAPRPKAEQGEPENVPIVNDSPVRATRARISFAPGAATDSKPAPTGPTTTPARRRVRMSLVSAAEIYSPAPPLPALPADSFPTDSPDRAAPEQSIRLVSSYKVVPRRSSLQRSGSKGSAKGTPRGGRRPGAGRTSWVRLDDGSPIKTRASLSPSRGAAAYEHDIGLASALDAIASAGPISRRNSMREPLPNEPAENDDNQDDEDEEEDIILLEEVEEEDEELPAEQDNEEVTGEADELNDVLDQDEAEEESPAPEPEPQAYSPPVSLPTTPLRLSPHKSNRKVSLRTAALLRTSGAAARRMSVEPRSAPLPQSAQASPALSRVAVASPVIIASPVAQQAPVEQAAAESDADSEDEEEVDRSLSLVSSPSRGSLVEEQAVTPAKEQILEPASPLKTSTPDRAKSLGNFMTPQPVRPLSFTRRPRKSANDAHADDAAAPIRMSPRISPTATAPRKSGRRSFVTSFLFGESAQAEIERATEEERSALQIHLTEKLSALEQEAEDALTDEEDAADAQEEPEMAEAQDADEVPADARETSIVEHQAAHADEHAEAPETTIVLHEPEELVETGEASVVEHPQSDEAVEPEQEHAVPEAASSAPLEQDAELEPPAEEIAAADQPEAATEQTQPQEPASVDAAEAEPNADAEDQPDAAADEKATEPAQHAASVPEPADAEPAAAPTTDVPAEQQEAPPAAEPLPPLEVKKGRSRATRSRATSAESNVEEVADAAAKPVRGGRRVPSKMTEAEAPVVPARKTSRPRRARNASAEVEASVEAPGLATETVEEVPEPKPSRSRKQSRAASVASQPETQDDAATAAPKRGRKASKPAAASTEEPTATADEPVTFPTDEAEDDASSTKRARSRKATTSSTKSRRKAAPLPDVDEMPTPMPSSDAAAHADNEGSSPLAPSKQRARRPTARSASKKAAIAISEVVAGADAKTAAEIAAEALTGAAEDAENEPVGGPRARTRSGRIRRG